MSLSTKLRFSGYFTDNGQQRAVERLNAAKEWLINEAKGKRAISNLQTVANELNGLFYPKDGTPTSALVQEYQQEILDISLRTIEKAFSNMDFTNDNWWKNTKINKGEKTVSDTTLQNWINKAETNLKVIENLLSSTPNAKSLLEAQSQLQNVIQNAKNFINKASADYELFGGRTKGGVTAYTLGSLGDEAVKLVKQMRALDIITRSGANYSPTDFGNAFEKALARANASIKDNGVPEVVNDMLEEMFKVGGNPVGRGTSRSGIVNMTANFDKALSKNKQKAYSKDKNFKISDDNFEATYTYDPTADKMGKMDVILKFPTKNSGVIEDLRVSAKNWTSSRSLGGTSIDAALNRAVGNTLAELYKFSMLDSTKDAWIKEKGRKKAEWKCKNAGHDLAKIALATDIVMGLNQGQAASGGLANVLVINDQQKIHVIDITELVTNMDKINKYLKYNDSKASSIEANALNIYKSIKIKKGRTETYMGLMTSTLNKMSVAYELSSDLSKI